MKILDLEVPPWIGNLQMHRKRFKTISDALSLLVINPRCKQKTPRLIPKAVIAAQQLIPVFTSRSKEQRSASQIRTSPAASPGAFATSGSVGIRWDPRSSNRLTFLPL